MCGIAGKISWAGEGIDAAEEVRQALESMRYRGPDAIGVYSGPGLALGNVRLAIQGIDPAGNQPIYNEDRSVVVVFNGEIYNFPELRMELEAAGHHFSTRTDTELLVHLYEDHGLQMADRLNGMFAFALFDERRGRLLLGRDRTAQKPLFLHRSDRGFCFSSELRSLLRWVDGPSFDPGGVRDFLSLGYFLEPGNILAGVESLPPGTVAAYDLEGNPTGSHAVPFPEWQEPCLQTDEKSGSRNFEMWLEKADHILGNAVQRHTLSDVPVTVFLSGGVDSSLMAAYLAERGGVSVVHSGSFSDETDYDEYPYSKSLADQLGLETRRVDLGKSVLAGAIEEFCASSSQPQGDYSGLPSYVLARETSRNFRVVLGGDGGDELFSGYPTYLLPELKRRWGFLPLAAIRSGAAFFRRFGRESGYLPLRFKLQLLEQAWALPTARAHFAIKDFFPPALVQDVLDPGFFGEYLNQPPGMDEFSRRFGWDAAPDAMRRLGLLDFSTFLGSCTIPKMERNCMHWSLENRLPLLDNEVLALAAETPAQWQRRGATGKWCLRQLLEKKLGERPRINPRKQGFGPPLSRMLAGELRPWADELLDRPHPAFRPGLREFMAAQSARGWDLHRLVWNICIFKDWSLRQKIGF